MSEDPGGGGWTFETLLAHLHAVLREMDLRYQQRFDSQQRALEDARVTDAKAVQAALSASEKAVIKAETATEKRFEAVNEFRSTLSDQAQHFASRTEVQALLSGLADRVEALDKKFTDKTDINTKTIEQIRSRGQGIAASWSYLVAGVVLIGGVIGIFVALR
jgi:hypothetical protein